MLTTLEFKASLPKEVGNAKASCLLLILQEQLFVWIGDSSQPVLQHMHYAIKAGPGGLKNAATTLFGNRFHNMGERLSNRLCTMLEIPVVCSWNLSASGIPQEELDLLGNLLAKMIKEKYQQQLLEEEDNKKPKESGAPAETQDRKGKVEVNVASLSLSPSPPQTNEG